MRRAARMPITATLFGLTALCMAAAAEVLDQWEERGELTLVGDGWNARFRKDWGAAGAPSGAEYSRSGQRVGIVPFDGDRAFADRLTACAVNDVDGGIDVALTFAVGERPLEVRVLIRDDGVLEISGAEPVRGVCLRAPIEVGVLPGMRLEDVLYYPDQYPDADEVHVPSENWLAGLMKGNAGIVACSWPEGDQALRLLLSGEPPDRLIEGVTFELAGQKLYAGVLAAPAIWHRESLKLDWLEKDRKLEWRRPFQAQYRAQVLLKGETTVPRTHDVSARRFEKWCPETGAYVWPVWFDGDDTWVQFGKRTPPKGNLVIYPYDKGDNTLVGFLTRTPLAEVITKRCEARGSSRGPRGAPNVGYNACWGTYLLRRTLYSFGVQYREREFLREHTDYLADHVAKVQTRNAQYFEFIDEMRAMLGGWLADEDRPEVRAFLESMSAHVDLVEQGHRQKMELYDDDTPEAHVAHADRNAARLKELLETPGQEVYPECWELIDEFNRMSWGHDESTGMRFSMLTRAWALDAALGCGANAATVEYAEAVRAAIRDILRHAPGW